MGNYVFLTLVSRKCINMLNGNKLEKEASINSI
jgi:hypothetical protein